jgi:hypothetical protein
MDRESYKNKQALLQAEGNEGPQKLDLSNRERKEINVQIRICVKVTQHTKQREILHLYKFLLVPKISVLSGLNYRRANLYT